MAQSLSQVLTSGGAASSFNFMQMTMVLTGICAAVFSAVKGYEIYRRNRFLSAVVEDGADNSEKVDKLNFLVDELKREKDLLLRQNREMQNELHSMRDLVKVKSRSRGKRASRKVS